MVKKAINQQSGATLVEYMLMLSFVLLVAVAGIGRMGQGIKDKFEDPQLVQALD